MASSAELAVAKASFSATLFRADPRSCSRDDIDHFFFLLNSAIAQCSPANVQKCKQWTLLNLVPSNGRIAPLGKYLCALANSFTPDKDSERRKAESTTGAFGFKKAQQPQQPHEPSAKRKRLHILYILNDILYHVKFRDRNDNFADKVESFLPALVRSVAAFPSCPKHTRKIKDLISVWEEKGYFAADSVNKLRDAVDKALVPETSENEKTTEADQTASASKAGKEAPFIMPAMHGDPNMPWYDLPAGNWLPVLEPNSTRPMKPSMIKPLQLAPGPVDTSLVEAVNKLLVNVDRLYSQGSSQANDGTYNIDQMGEVIELDEVNGEVINGETYYGWSRAFCEKMKARRRKARSGDADNDRPLSRSYSRSLSGSRSRSRSSSRPGMKRRRLSDSRNPPRRMRNDSRGSSRSRSRSRSRSYSPRRRSISHTRSRSRSRSRNRGRRSRSPSSRYSPPPPSGPAQIQQQQNMAGGYNPYNQPPPRQPSHNQQPPPPLPGMPLPPHPGHGGYQPHPVPPPPPPNYRGQWPPPPPPQMGGGMPQMPFPGGWHVPPPSMPGMGMMPQNMNPQQQQPQYPPQQPQPWQQQDPRNQPQPWHVQQPPPHQQQQQQPPQNPQNQYGWGRGAAQPQQPHQQPPPNPQNQYGWGHGAGGNNSQGGAGRGGWTGSW